MFDIYRKDKHGEKRCLEELAVVEVWRDAAAADGWSIEPTYQTEPVDRAARLKHPKGYTGQILTRNDLTDVRAAPRVEASVYLWGPDGLAVTAPRRYDFAKIEASAKTCANCKKTDVETVRYSFAGRCCKDCLPEMRAKHEKPGWCD